METIIAKRGGQFFKRNFTPRKNSFSGYSFFHLTDIPACENSFSVKWKRFFLTNSSFQLVETERVFFLFRALLKLLKFGGGNSCLRKLIFWLVELIFSHFSDTRSSESYFPCSGNVCLNEFSNPYGGDAFSVLWKPFSLI